MVLCMPVDWEVYIFTLPFLYKLHSAGGMPIMCLFVGTVLTFWQCPALLYCLYRDLPQCQENFYMHHADFPSLSLDFFVEKSRESCGVSFSATSYKNMSLGPFFSSDIALMTFYDNNVYKKCQIKSILSTPRSCLVGLVVYLHSFSNLCSTAICPLSLNFTVSSYQEANSVWTLQSPPL